LFQAFAFHAKKYCPTGGQCLTNQGLEKRKKEEAANPFYLARH
jgi:hypothetical protein